MCVFCVVLMTVSEDKEMCHFMFLEGTDFTGAFRMDKRKKSECSPMCKPQEEGSTYYDVLT